MLPPAHYISQAKFLSPTIRPSLPTTKTNIFFTYHSSPVRSPQQSLKVIKELNESKRKKRIFEPRRKLSYRSIDSNNMRKERLRIFDGPGAKRVPALQSHIFLKDSVVSNETIVDQLQELEESHSLKNPITKKLQSMKQNRDTKRTFYSNTVKNSLMFNDRQSVQQPLNRRLSVEMREKRNRIESEVLNFNYQPGNIAKNYSSVTIKASKQTRPFGNSKMSNNLSIITNNNQNHNYVFSAFKDTENVETPKYHRSTYKSMRKSFEPGFMGDLERREKQLMHNETKRQPISPGAELSYPQTDRFYDQSSLETPRLPMCVKKVSYEVIDPLTNSLRKQKQQKKELLRKLSEQQQAVKKATNTQNKLKGNRFFEAIIRSITSFANETIHKVTRGTMLCVNFTRSEVFVIMIIVMLSLAIFVIQLVQ